MLAQGAETIGVEAVAGAAAAAAEDGSLDVDKNVKGSEGTRRKSEGVPRKRPPRRRTP